MIGRAAEPKSISPDEEGEFEAARRLARNFKNAGISAEIIAENTGLSLEEIEKL